MQKRDEGEMWLERKCGLRQFYNSILPSEEKIAPMYERLSKFHKEFMDKYKDDKEN